MSSVKLLCRSELWDDQDLDLNTAFKRRPDVVREALLEAFRQTGVAFSMRGIRMLWIEQTFRTALGGASKLRDRNMLSMIISCCSGDLGRIVGGIFYEYGLTYGLVLLAIAMQETPGILQEIGRLSRKDQIHLVTVLTKDPPNHVTRDLMLEGAIYEGKLVLAQLWYFTLLTDVSEHILLLLPQLKRYQNGIAFSIPFLVNAIEPAPKPAVEQFKYSPIRKGAQIRLIKFDRTRSFPDIICTLVDVPLRPNIKYEALSYTVWKLSSLSSSSPNSIPICLDTGSLLIISVSVGQCFGRLETHTHKPTTISGDTQPFLSLATSSSPYILTN